MTGDIGGKEFLVNTALVDRLVGVSKWDGFSKLELLYYLMKMAPRQTRNAFDLTGFVS